jgi:putative acetyltransferase
MKPDIRESRPEELAIVEDLYPRAFPDENLVPLLRELLADSDTVLSLVASVDDRIAGHGIFTHCRVGDTDVALLGPLAVDPSFQRQGIGSAIVRDGLRRLKDAGTQSVCVLGDPDYYGRLGFTREDAIEPPYRLPDEWADAWQSVTLGDAGQRSVGALSVPPAWQRQALWAP